MCPCCAREHAWCGRCAFCREGACREEEPAVMGTGENWTPFKDINIWCGYTLLYEPAVFLPQKNTCILPEDLRDFYLTTDGFTLTWSVKLDSR